MTCKYKGCERRLYARQMCQSHHRQDARGEKLTAVRPYRPRDAHRVRYGGVMLSDKTAAALRRWASRLGCSMAAVISVALDEAVSR